MWSLLGYCMFFPEKQSWTGLRQWLTWINFTLMEGLVFFYSFARILKRRTFIRCTCFAWLPNYVMCILVDSRATLLDLSYSKPTDNDFRRKLEAQIISISFVAGSDRKTLRIAFLEASQMSKSYGRIMRRLVALSSAFKSSLQMVATKGNSQFAVTFVARARPFYLTTLQIKWNSKI